MYLFTDQEQEESTWEWSSLLDKIKVQWKALIINSFLAVFQGGLMKDDREFKQSHNLNYQGPNLLIYKIWLLLWKTQLMGNL